MSDAEMSPGMAQTPDSDSFAVSKPVAATIIVITTCVKYINYK